MAGEWTYELWCVVPITARDTISQICARVMPDVDEGAMFDSIRASADGNEPATHLMTVCPLRPRETKLWKELCLVADDLSDFPKTEPSQDDKADFATIRQNAKFFAVITDRLDGNRLKQEREVKLIDDRYSGTRQMSTVADALGKVGLVQIRASWRQGKR